MSQRDIGRHLASHTHSAFMSSSKRRRSYTGTPMSSMTLIIERTPRTLKLRGQTFHAEELGVHLPFACKPTSLREMCATGEHRIYIIETVEMTIAEFDDFATDLTRPQAWLAGKGGNVADGCLCIEVRAPGRPYLYVDPSGYNYARYLARLG